jgi:hypothetical protein
MIELRGAKTLTVLSIATLALLCPMHAPAFAAACTSPIGNEGDINYSAPQHLMIYCNGTSWITMGESSPISFGTLTTGDLCAATSGTSLACVGTLSGDVTSSAGAATVTSVSAIQGTAVTGTTGTGKVVFSTSPTFTGTITAGSSTWSGTIGIATNNPMSELQVNGGEVQIGSSGASCTINNAGAIRYSAGTLYYCNSTAWTSSSSGGASTVNIGSQYQMAYYAANGTAVTGDANIVTDSSNDMLISGKVGIGTAAPTQPLTVWGNVDSGNAGGYLTEIANAGTTGTTVNKLAKLNASGAGLIAATTDTDGMVGIVVGGAGTSGNAQIAVDGQASCVFDGATTAGHFVTISGTTAGDCSDSATRSTTKQTIGFVLSTNASAGTYLVKLNLNGAGGGAAVTLGTSASVTNPQRGGEVTTGLFSGGSGLVDVSSLGTQVAELSSTGLNLGTSAATAGALNLGGVNGISFSSSDSIPGGSIAIGSQALSHQSALSSAGFHNTAVGYQAIGGSGLTTGAIFNTALGFEALQGNTSGGFNIAVGAQALLANTTGSGNAAVGAEALISNTIGGGNSAVGLAALFSNSTGSNNVAVGTNALFDNTLGGGNVAVGLSALFANTFGSNNIAVGLSALAHNTTGANNVAVGNLVASTTLITGSNNILIGNDNTTDTATASTSNAIGIGQGVHPGAGDIAIGQGALQSTTQDNNNSVAIGASALLRDTTGFNNTAIGISALAKNTTGSNNMASGQGALVNNTLGGDNTASGADALTSNTTGNFNTAIGDFALDQNTTGSSNTVIGFDVASSTLTSGSKNILIGTGSAVDTPAAATNNFLNIGNLIYGTGIGIAASPGNVGIGVTAPANRLDVNGGEAIGSYAGVNTAPTNGIIVSGEVGIGTASTVNDLDVFGAAAFGSFAGRVAPTGGIIASGSVGIGLTGPGAPLEVRGSSAGFASNAGNLALTTASSTAGLRFGINDSNYSWISSFSSLPLYINAGGNNTILNATSGNVGIGTTSPATMLDVRAPGTYSAENNGLYVSNGNTSPYSFIQLGYDSTISAGFIRAGQSATGLKNLVLEPQGGNVGIGTTSPGQLLTVAGRTNASGGLEIDDTNGSYVPQAGVGAAAFINYGGPAFDVGLLLESRNSGTSTAFDFFNGTSQAGSVSYTATATNYNTASDSRLKENVAPTTRGLNKLGEIQVDDFNFIIDPKKERVQGFIAQEFYKIYPEAVSVGGDDPKKQPWSVDYGRLTPLIVKSIQELKADNDNLRAANDSEAAQIKTLTARLDVLEASRR